VPFTVRPATFDQGLAAAFSSAWPFKLTDGVNTPAILNTAPGGTEYALAVRQVGTVAVSNFPSSFSVSNFPGTQPVSGSVSVSNFPGTQPVSGTFWQATQPVSGTFWQATQPVSGTVTANQGAAAALSSGWPVKITDGVNTMPTGDAVGRALYHKLTDGTNTASVSAAGAVKVDGSAVTQPVSGTFWQATQPVSGTFWQATQPVSAASLPLPTGAAQDSTLSTMSGKLTDEPASTAAASESLTTRLSTTTVLRLLDTGGAAGSQLVVAKGDQTTGLWVNIKNASVPVTGTFWQATQPVSGTVTANQGTAAALSSGWPVKVTDGTNTMPTADAAARALYTRLTDGTLSLTLLNAAPGSDTGQVAVPVRVISSLAGGGSGGTASNFGSGFPAAGTASGYSDGTNMQGARVFDLDSGAGTQYVLGIGLRLSASGGSVEGGTSANPIRTDPTGTTVQPVSGTFWQATQPISAASLPLPTGAAQDSTLSTLSGKFTDDAASNAAASESAATRLSTTSVLRLLDTSLGAGAQLVVAKGDQTTGLWVNIKNASLAVTGTFWQATQPVSGTFWQATQPVSGTVTANQGTAAALSSGWPVKITDGTNTMPTGDVVGRAIFHKVTDGTNTAAVKAASTAAAATDPSLVVALHPTSPLPAGTNVIGALSANQSVNLAQVGAAAFSLGQKTMANSMPVVFASDQSVLTVQGNQPAATTGSITAANSTVSMATNNLNVITVTLTGATFVGVQFVFEGSADSGTTWSLLQGSRTDTGLIETGTSYALGNANAPRSWDIPIGGLTNLRVRATAWTSGTATITMIGQVFAYDPAPTATVQPRRLTSYSAGYRLAASTAGQLSATFTFVANTEKQLATIYHAATATKIVRIRKISVFVSTGALGVFGFEVKRLSATTAPATGNPAITPGAMDSSSAAAEATCLTLPTTAGSLSATDSAITPHFEWNSAAAAAVANPSGLSGQEIVLYDYRQCDERQPLTMRAGLAEGFAVIGRCTTAVALRFTVHIEFTEEGL
jgi:hypothetical protein